MQEFKGKAIVITGASHGIGLCTKKLFLEQGATVFDMDLTGDAFFHGDVGKKEDLEAFYRKVTEVTSEIFLLVNNAPPLFRGIKKATYEDFEAALRVGAAAPFYLTKLFLPHFGKGASVINISSSRDRQSQPQSETYSAAKGAIAALTHSLAISLGGKVRVNSISPGWIDTTDGEFFGADNTQHPAGRVGTPEDVANAILFLASEKAGFITGENLCIDGGMTRLMVYHNDHGWTLDQK